MKSWFPFILFLITLQAHAFDEFKVSEKLGLHYGLSGNPWTFLGTHSVFVNETLGRQMMVVNNVPGRVKETQFIEAEGYLIVQIPTGKETFTSVALVGITREQFLPYVDQVTIWQRLKNELMPFPNAYATNCGVPGMPAVPGITQIVNYFTSGAGAGFARCIMNFAQGAWSATGGAVAGFIEGVGNLFSDPVGFWNGKVAQMRNMWNFVTHFRTKMGEAMEHLRGLPQEVITNMMCAFLGGVGASAAVAILTGGAGLGSLLLRVTSYVSRISGLTRVLGLLGGLGRLGSIPTRFYEGIASGRISEAVIDRIDSFARNRMTNVVEGAIQCAI